MPFLTIAFAICLSIACPVTWASTGTSGPDRLLLQLEMERQPDPAFKVEIFKSGLIRIQHSIPRESDVAPRTMQLGQSDLAQVTADVTLLATLPLVTETRELVCFKATATKSKLAVAAENDAPEHRKIVLTSSDCALSRYTHPVDANQTEQAELLVQQILNWISKSK